MSDISLEIHHLDVRGGDATAILVKDLEQDTKTGGKLIYSVLIDSGAESSGSDYLLTYLKSNLTEEFNCMIATHFHKDHIKGISQNSPIRFKQFIDNGGYEANRETEFAPNGLGSGATSKVFSNYKARIEEHLTIHGAKRLKLPFVAAKTAGGKKPFSFELGYKEITLTCYCANGILADGQDIVGPKKKKKNREPSPNDLSLAFVLKWGDFRYFTAGDLSGEDTTVYFDVETSLVTYLKKQKPAVFPPGAVSIFKASHHGSAHSNQAELLKFVNPQTIVVSVNDDKDVPSEIFLERLKTHFATNAVKKPQAMAVFSNWLTVHDGDKRLVKLKALQAAKRIVEKNLNDMTKGTLSNKHVKSVLIRRRVKDGKPVAYDDVPKPSGKEFPTVVGRMPTENNQYEIVLMKREKGEVDNIVKSSTPKTFKLEASWLEVDCNQKDIEDGFEAQAKTLADWHKGDKQGKSEVGKDYVTACYPAFADRWSAKNSATLEKNILADMKAMFKASFKLKNDGTSFGSSPDAAKLSGKKQQTINFLLRNNSRQSKFNQAAYKHKDVVYWNEVNAEPYGTTTGQKRKAQEIRKSDRVTKRPKK
jgi:hypothetical protein